MPKGLEGLMPVLIDLTKGGDIIRSRTYSAFMPLFAVALIDLTKHPQYKYTADANPKYAFDVKAYLQHRLKVKPEEEFEVYDLGEIKQPQAAA